ncbi:MAG: PIN domain-containing protein [Acidimicrobiales bacterium]
MEPLYLDTNVLFPMTLMDLVLSMAEDFHHDLLWSDFLLEEWERVVVREQRRTPEQASAIAGAIRQAFPSGRIAPEDYESVIEAVPGPDPDDRVHGAAALAGGATALITANLRHFDGEFFADHGVIVETPELSPATAGACARSPHRDGEAGSGDEGWAGMDRW